jgi:hypothetical protein
MMGMTMETVEIKRLMTEMVPKPPIIQVAAGNGALMLVSPPDLFRK